MLEYMTSEEKQEAIEKGILTQLCDCDNCMLFQGGCDCLAAGCINMKGNK